MTHPHAPFLGSLEKESVPLSSYVARALLPIRQRWTALHSATGMIRRVYRRLWPLTVANAAVQFSDIRGGLIKACFFGIILSWVGSYKGYNTHGGARGVGLATTQSVVLSSIIILVSNYFLTKMLEQL